MRNKLKRFLVSLIVLSTLLFIPVFVTALEVSSSANVSVEPKVTQNGITLKLKSDKELKAIRIYRKSADNKFILFYKGTGLNTKEKDIYFSRITIPEKVSLKVVVIDKDGNESSGDLPEIELPPMPSINPSETATPSVSTHPIPTFPSPSTSPSQQPTQSPSTEPTPTKETITYNGKKYKVPVGDKVYFLDVADKNGSNYQGSDCMLVCSEGKYGLIDATLSSKGKRVVKHLKELGVKELDFIMVSHDHGDHVGGISTICKAFPVKTLYIKRTTGGKYSGCVSAAKKAGAKVVYGKNLTGFTFGNFKFKFYSTKDIRSSVDNENVNCLTAVATVQGKKIYFAGDIQNQAGKNIWTERDTAKKIGKIDIYKVGHHCYTGSTNNNTQAAVNALRPSSAVATNHSKRSGTGTGYNRIKAYTKAKNFYWCGKGTVLLNITSSGSVSYKQFPEEK